jgi:hypothetical protein
MTIPVSLAALTIVPASTTVNALTSYSFSITFSTVQYSGNKLLITIPTGITLASMNCSVISGLSNISCSSASNLITGIMIFTTFPSNYSIGFIINGLINNWYTLTSSIGIQALTNDSLSYYT